MDSSPDPGIARSSGPGSARASLLAPAAVVVVGLAVTVLASGAAAVAHDASVRADMIEHAHTRIQAVARVLDSTATQVVALQALYRASGEVEPSEFDTFAATLLASGDAAAFEWVPRVRAADRAAWEAAHMPVGITERGGAGLQPAGARQEYFPVEVVVPLRPNQRALGFDLGSESDRADMLAKARATGRILAGGPVELVQGGTGFLTVAPVVREGEDDGLVGFVVSVSVASDVLTAALAPLPDDNLVVRLFREEEGVKGTLGSWPAGAVGAAPTSIVSEVVELSSGAFRVEVEPTSGFEASHRSAAPRWVLTAGLMFTALLAGYVRLLGSRAAAAREHAAMLTREMEERRRAEAAAVELEARFRALAEEAPVGIYLLQDGRFQYVNHRFAKAFGMAPADVHTPDELPATGEAWLPGDAEIEVDGRTLQLHAVHTQIDGREAVIGTVNDVTEARRSESERQRAEQLEALGVLAASIAHDFNNLLAVILGNVSMAQMRAGQSSSLLAEAEQAVLRAQGLTSQLSSFARGGEPVRVPMDVGPVVREAVAFALRGSAATASVDVEAGVWAVNGDSSQLSRVFHNLVLNAVQAMDGRGKVTVSVRNRVRGAPGRRYVEIQVQDQGKGMAPETPEHIFDPYFTTRTAGRGLGLASAHSIVRRHQGQIEVESAPGQGASFTVVLPAHDGPAAAGKDAAGPAPAAGGERVLVMDDDPFVRSAAARLVESHGYVVVAVDDGRQAVAAWRGAIAEGRPFAAAILDLTVPGGHGGQQAIAEILDIDPTALGIASSGYADDPIMANFAEYGFAGVLPKPYRRDEIGNVLRRVIATR